MQKFKWIFLIVILTFSGCTEDIPGVPQECPPEPEDTQAPSRVTDLSAVAVTDTTIELSWTAPGDDQTEGRASFYDLRYSSDVEALRAWSENCSRASEMTPANSGETESITISGLGVSETKYFGLKAADSDSNWSPTSNLIQVETLCPMVFSGPGSGSRFCEGDTVDILWEVLECQSETVSIYLQHENETCRTIANDIENSGEYRWVAQQYWDHVEGYRIALRAAGEDGSLLPSPGSFFITNGCEVQVSFPNGGEILCRGSVIPITWIRSSCCDNGFLVELLQNSTAIDTLESAQAKRQDWVVDSPLAAEAGYQIRVTNLQTGGTDTSDYSFQITVPHSPALQYPTGGEVLSESEDIVISWEPQECTGSSARIELQHNGQICLVIAEHTSNDGDFRWTPVSAGEGPDGYRIVVTDLTTNYSASSPGEFTIPRICIMEYLTPVAGSEFCPEEIMNITWTSQHWCGDMVKIEMHQGYSSSTIIQETPNDGSYSHPAPPLSVSGTKYIRIIDLDTGAFINGSPITLFPSCQVRGWIPDGGGVYYNGLTLDISWEAGDCCGPLLDIQLVRDGTVCSTIAENLDINQGHYEWTVEACSGQIAGYKIKLIESGYNRSYLTYPTFSIEGGCGFLVLSPTAEDVYYEGDLLPVSWSSGSLCSDEVDIELLGRDDEVLWGPERVLNTGATEILPIIDPTGITWCRVRVSNSSSSSYSTSEEFEFRSSPFILQPDGSGDFPTIQQAVDAARPGYEILLDDGVYSGYKSQSMVSITTGDFSISSLNGNPANCILDGNSSVRILNLRNLEHPLQVSGITFRNGKAQMDNNYRGGAVYLTSGQATFSNCIFEQNYAETSGGAVAGTCATLEFTECIFRGSRIRNSAEFSGVAVNFLMSSDHCPNEYLSLQNCTFVDNGTDGGAVIALSGEFECRIENTIIGFNPIAALFVEESESNLLIECSNLYLNAQEGWPEEFSDWLVGHNNFSEDPDFCDLEMGNVNIGADSPCSALNSPCGENVGAGEVGCR